MFKWIYEKIADNVCELIISEIRVDIEMQVRKQLVEYGFKFETKARPLSDRGVNGGDILMGNEEGSAFQETAVLK